MLIGITSFIMESAVPQVEAQGKSASEVTVDSSVSQVELGRQLFIAKGCITCHVNNKTTRDTEYWTRRVISEYYPCLCGVNLVAHVV